MNSNIRCIEISGMKMTVRWQQELNSNIRCIEMDYLKPTDYMLEVE